MRSVHRAQAYECCGRLRPPDLPSFLVLKGRIDDVEKLAAALSSLALCSIATQSPVQVSSDVVKTGLAVDLSSLDANVTGQGVIHSVRRANVDMGGSVDTKKIELVFADYQNEADVAANKARE
ncbi:MULTISPECIES: hypothetical protein [Noviherbaspirillum]|uniref:hypothetical protein n=1 Tax=Noviherbaspirillum TaxID=1344552 RepID=UPI00124C3085|nr:MULTISPECIES: hypothetical protein [Noviherbaspirillum]